MGRFVRREARRKARVAVPGEECAPALPFLVRFHLSPFGFSSGEEMRAETPVLARSTRVGMRGLVSLQRMLRGVAGDDVAASAVVTKYLYGISTRWAVSPFFPQMRTVPNCFCIADI